MSITDIIWPWGALKRARRDLAAAREDMRTLETYKARVALLTVAHDKAKALIAQGHFRNPETGRLGTKGQLFQ
jgi:hypothetical protein